ncbi:unnamed protein product [Candidula unifasciata]|uniref:Cadherin domain-containing protein n=1 Tax=Candidula unifasciata TaxID=100452 RepID=A0A8S4A3D8_9EUPU|nr:unnamed protein product [Candidula unifasciata]
MKRITESVSLILTFLALTVTIFCYQGYSQQYGQVEFRIKEQMPSGTNVGNIRDKARIADKVPKNELSSLSFKFLNPNNLLQTASLFSINSDNGAIYTTAMIDRESICQFQKNCNVEFEVTVTSTISKFFEIVSVRIVIEDINDNAPRFQNEEVTLHISESVNVNSEFRIAGATDKDNDDENSVRKYEMKSEYNDMFELKSEMKLDWTWDLSIVVLKPLDRETKDHYVLCIIAKDNGNPPRSGNVTVHINVTDTNDNPPVFTENTYEVSVGAVVGQVKALDADINMNGEVTYKFSPTRSSQIEDLFYIDTLSGEVKVKNPLQYEAGKSFETIVVASDRGNPPRASQAILIINVIDVGNTPPRISVNPVPNPEGNILFLTEASPLETVVAHVRTDDRDTGLNGVVDCSSRSPKFKVRRFEGSGFLVEISKPLDRETEEELNVTIVCEDRGVPKLSALGWFVIKLTDANDNDPVFTKTIYRANLTENNRKGERILYVKAFDKDIGDNANIRYSFSVDGEEPSFIIDPVTGEITAGQEYDRETVSQVQGKTSVIVDIIDQNDNTPYFTSSLEFQVAENLPAGSRVDTLEAKDRDDGQNAEVVFYMPDDSFRMSTSIPFVVLPNGVIKTDSILDKDKQSLYTFPVVVKDRGKPPRSSSATATVHVIDSNDHKPVFIFPTKHNNTVRFRSDTSPGSLITRLIATDEDVGRNARLKYSIVSGNHEKVFTMPDPNSGEIRLSNDSELLYGVQTNMFRLNVSVRDQGIPVLETTAMLHIQIDYVDGYGLRRSRPEDDNPASALDEDDVKYIIIAGVIGGITVIISIIIVTIILLMRKPDNNRTSGVAGVQEQGDGRHFEKHLWHSVPVDDVVPAEVCDKKIGHDSLKGGGGGCGVSGGCTLDPKPNNGGLISNSNHDLIDPYNRKHISEPLTGQQQLYTFKKVRPSLCCGSQLFTQTSLCKCNCHCRLSQSL